MRWIGSRPPRFWASIYVLLIPIEGTVFWALPGGSFYDSNLVREAGYRHDLATVSNLLTRAVRKQDYGDGMSNKVGPPTWVANGSRVVIYRSSLDTLAASVSASASGNITFTVKGLAGSQKTPYTSIDFGDTITLSSAPTDAINPLDGNPLLIGYAASAASITTATSVLPPLNVLLPEPAGGNSTSPDESVLFVSPSAAVVMSRLSHASEGDPKAASGLLVRMCYFSAITITTLGFGDITPVSSLSRALVAIEAVCGVVLIGLFLNAVAQKWGTHRESRTTSGGSLATGLDAKEAADHHVS
jgi:Ion channel